MIEWVGAGFLGVFVGYVLGVGLAKVAAGPVRAAVAVVGAAVVGGPIAFLGIAHTRWVYPVGLLAGFLLSRKNETQRDTPSDAQLFGGILLVGILISGALSTLGTGRPRRLADGTESVTGYVHTPAARRYEVHYPRPFEWSPHVNVTCNGCTVVEQRPDLFIVETSPADTSVSWEARGVPKGTN